MTLLNFRMGGVAGDITTPPFDTTYHALGGEVQLVHKNIYI